MLSSQGYLRESSHLLQLVSSGQGWSCIDHILTFGLQVHEYRVEDIAEVPHRPLTASLTLPRGSQLNLLPKVSPRWKLGRKQLCSFEDLLSTGLNNLLRIYPQPSVTQLYHVFDQCIKQCCELSKPTAFDRKTGWRFFLTTSEIDRLESLRVAATTANAVLDTSKDQAALQLALCCKRSYLEAKRELRQSALLRLSSSDQAKFANGQSVWKLLKDLRPSSDPVPIAPAVLQDHFSSVFYEPQLSLITQVPVLRMGPTVPVDSFLITPFRMEELADAMRDMNENSAPGPDKIPFSVLKVLFKSKEACKWLLLFLNQCFDQGRMPDEWAESEIFVLFKGKGSTDDPNNYRGITLLNSMFKIYERLIYARMNIWAAERGILGENQFGFRKGRSTVDPVKVVLALIEKYPKLNRQPLHSLYIDVRKAFPSVPRSQLMNHLAFLGVPEKMLRAIASHLSFNTARIRIGDVLTEKFFVNIGVREGGVLSPLLFAIYYAGVLDIVNQFLNLHSPSNPTLSEDSNVIGGLLYADDLVVFGLSREELQVRFDLVSQYFVEFGLSINVNKSEVLTFLPVRYPVRLCSQFSRIKFGQSVLPEVSKVKYLGFWFTADGKLDYHVAVCAQKAKVASLELVRLLRKLECNNLVLAANLYRAFVQSQFYGVPLLSPISLTKELKRSAVYFFTSLVGLPRTTAIDFCFAISLFDDPMLLQISQRVKLWERVRAYEEESAVLDAFRFDRLELMPRGRGWFAYLNFVFSILLANDNARTAGPVNSWDYLALFHTTKDELLARSKMSNLRNIFVKPTCALVIEVFNGCIPRDFWAAFEEFGVAAIRPVLMLFTGSARWSGFGMERRICPSCSASLYGLHFLTCDHLRGTLIPLNLTLSRARDLVKKGDWHGVIRFWLQVFFVWFDYLGSQPLPSDLERLRSIL